jgi:N utilization substance protein A
MFVDALDVDDVIAHLLVTEGFSSVEEVAFVPVEDMVGIEGFDDEISEELRQRARAYLETKDEVLSERSKELKVSDDLAEVEGVDLGLLVALGEKEIKTRDDLADLAADELMEIAPVGTLKAAQANDIIMAARAHWFKDEIQEKVPVGEEVAGDLISIGEEKDKQS